MATVHELADVLGEEAAIYDLLVSAAKRKKDIVIRNDLPALDAVMQEENDAAGRLMRLERRRLSLSKSLGGILSIEENKITVMSIASKLSDNEEAERLRLLAKRLRAQITELQGINGDVVALIEGTLEYIEFSINAIRARTGLNIDKGRGALIRHEGKSLIDVKG